MNALIFQLCVSAVAGWVNRGQQRVIEYLLEENRVLCEQLGRRRLRLTDAQRRRLAVRAKALGRQALMGVACVVTPPAHHPDRVPDPLHSERNHQGLGNKLLTPPPANSNAGGSIQCRERLGGILNHYYREAA